MYMFSRCLHLACITDVIHIWNMYHRRDSHLKHVSQTWFTSETCITDVIYIWNMYHRRDLHLKHVSQTWFTSEMYYRNENKISNQKVEHWRCDAKTLVICVTFIIQLRVFNWRAVDSEVCCVSCWHTNNNIHSLNHSVEHQHRRLFSVSVFLSVCERKFVLFFALFLGVFLKFPVQGCLRF